MKNALPTVDIKGKEYVLVKDRILAFNTLYKNGYIQTELVSAPESKTIIVRAIVTPDASTPERKFIDYSQAVVGQGMVNMTAALENASTSAVGRALAYMGIGVIESIASADEVRKATSPPKNEPQRVSPSVPTSDSFPDEPDTEAPVSYEASDKQKRFIGVLIKGSPMSEAEFLAEYKMTDLRGLTKALASQMIEHLQSLQGEPK